MWIERFDKREVSNIKQQRMENKMQITAKSYFNGAR